MTTLVAGVDLSTQATKVIVSDADTGEIRREGRATHLEATEIEPARWLAAFEAATSGGLLDDVEAIAVGGQQHGLVLLDRDGSVVRPALLWNDNRSGGAATALVEELGRSEWADAVGSVPVASFTITKLRWVAEHEPHLAQQADAAVLPHDWLTSRLLRGARLVTDRGDASGTGYWSPFDGRYRNDLLIRAFGRDLKTPAVLGPAEIAGETVDGKIVAAGTGDNMAAALGLGATTGDLIVSIGTSGTVSAVHDAPTADRSGAVAGFCDATGHFLPLVCTLNAARVLVATAELLGTNLAGLDQLALAAEPGAGGLVMVPYLDGERTPNRPNATGTLRGLTRASMTPANLARAAVEGMLCGLADAVEALTARGITPNRAILIGGGANSLAVQALAPSILGVPMMVPDPAEYVAKGAARQAAWALRGSLPTWHVPTGETLVPTFDAAPVRAGYAAARGRVD
ncbi:MAG TPA: FGGY family carbohydrate kinase [Mycobacteriales bacterium]|jgi:xylulokinase|nr:FGGY family carbohydrate kinase [Mycobacteriales bacterium]